jgi:hypothetical protein
MESNELLRVQHEVTSERDPEKHRAAIDQAYVEDLRFLDSEAESSGGKCSAIACNKFLTAHHRTS